MRLRKNELDREIARSDERDRSGASPRALGAALAEREQEIADIAAKISKPNPIRSLRGLEYSQIGWTTHEGSGRFIERRCAARSRGTGQTHQENHDDAGGGHYIASGSWDLLERGRIDGAGGPIKPVRTI